MSNKITCIYEVSNLFLPYDIQLLEKNIKFSFILFCKKICKNIILLLDVLKFENLSVQ